MSANTNEQNSENTKHQTMSKKPRLDHTMTYEEMLQLEQHRANRARVEDEEWCQNPTIDLGIPRIKSIRVSSLGPFLRRKFVHPGGI